MQTVGKLDKKHTDVTGNGHQKFAEVFRLLGLFGNEIQLLDLGKPIDQRSYLAAEELIDFGARRVRIFDHIMKQRGCDRRIVKFEIG